MADSLQKWVGRNRPPRVQITYDVEIGNAVEKKELPLVVGLLADLSGQPLNPPPKLKERRFVEIDRDNFNEVMATIAPRLDLSVPDTLKGEGNLKVELNFTDFGHFHPEAIVKQVPRLARLLEARQQLRDLELQAETQMSSRLEAARAAQQVFDPLLVVVPEDCSDEDGHVLLVGQAGIGFLTKRRGRIDNQHRSAMQLVQKHWLGTNGTLKNRPVGSHMRRHIAHMVAQIEAVVGCN